MATFRNAAPRVVFDGINDRSRGTPVLEPETFPQHLPLLRLFTQTGPEETTLVNGSFFNRIYGSQTLNRRSKFFNTQSLLAEQMLGAGNQIFVKRLRPEDAPDPARLIVAIDIVEDEIPKVTKTLSGFDYPNEVTEEESTLTTDGTTEMVLGYRAKIVLIDDNGSAVGTQKVGPGGFVANVDGEQSTLYPLFELPASFFGDLGNLVGMRIWAPTTNDNRPFDEATTREFLTRMFRVQLMRRDSAGTSPVPVLTVTGEEYVDVCFTPGAYSSSTDREYYIGDVLVPQYEDDGIDLGVPPTFCPFSDIHVYQDNVALVQGLIQVREHSLNPASTTTLEGPGQVDFLTGVDLDGDRYQSLLLEGPLNGGIRLGRDTVIYANGGGDGTTDLAMYETLVNRENLNFGRMGDEYENLAKYPFSVVYDTGLSMEGKYNMMEILADRQDIRTIFTTFVEADGRMPTKSEELSRTQALMARLRAYPEAVLYSTPVCRAEIIQQSGKLVSSNYLRPVPQVIDYALRWADYAGAGDGRLREGRAIDVSPNNHVTLLKDLNVEFFNERTQSELWGSGATYSLTYDRRRNYYPCIRSIYSDDTSVLLSPITVAVCCDLMRLVNRVHADFSGNARITREQFIEQADERIRNDVEGKYDDRVIVIPETYFTENDDQRGFTWHCRVTVYANNPRTVMIFDLVTRRMEDFES